MPYTAAMHAVVETSVFTRRAEALLSADERTKLIDMLATNPTAGDVIPGLGGIRKMRFAAGGRGQSKGYRVIYFLLTDDYPIVALLLYGKNEQVNPTAAQRKAMVQIVVGMRARARAIRSDEE